MSAVIRACALLARASHDIDDLSDEQRDIWRQVAHDARREYDALVKAAKAIQGRIAFVEAAGGTELRVEFRRLYDAIAKADGVDV